MGGGDCAVVVAVDGLVAPCASGLGAAGGEGAGVYPSGEGGAAAVLAGAVLGVEVDGVGDELAVVVPDGFRLELVGEGSQPVGEPGSYRG